MGPELSSKTIQFISTIEVQKAGNKKRVVAPPACFSCAPAAEPVPESRCRVKTFGARRPHASQAFFTPGMPGGYLFFTQFMLPLPCVRHMGVLIRYDKFEVSHFSAFFRNSYLSS